ncbi:MAG: hypothetical protein ORN24_04870, partial [Burkholderiales bacterium]|nr:hypothetical protein [Burkholderiales bacterium]
IVLDWFFFQAHLNQINYNWGHYYDPGGLFLFIIFFMLIANYFTAFLRAYNYIKTIYCTAIAGILLQIFLVYISKTHIIYFSINQQHNLVYNFITFSFLNYLLCSCIPVLCVIFFILPKISKVNKSSEELYQTWKLDIKFFTLSSLQANLRFLLIIIIKIFSPNSHDVTKFAYVFGIIGFIYIIRKLSKQTSQTVIAKYIAYNNYLALRQYIAKFIAFNLITVAAIVVAIIELRQIYLTHFGLTHYYNLMLLLMLSESLIAIFEPLFSNFLLFYNQSSLKFISILKITYCILLAALTMLVVSYYHLSGTLILCFGSSLVLIIIQTIAFLHYLKQFKLHQLI